MSTLGGWTAADLAAVDDTAEIHPASRRGDGTLRPARIVWVVRHDDALYVRSVNGPDAAWYRGVQARHQGVISAGDLQHDVNFVEADHSRGNSLHHHGPATNRGDGQDTGQELHRRRLHEPDLRR
jgi:hypothetical protein